jgi:pimeloyl-ACP methyl ester carboxylesterase
MQPMSSQIFPLPDGRQLGYAVEGEGKPVIYFHGTASSRLEIMLLRQFAHENRLMLIGVDRPGYGLSAFTDRLRLRDFAADVNALADHLVLSNFAVLSWSGGGPFALTFTALNPERVTNAVVVGSPALPFDPSVAHNNNPLAKVAMKAPFLAKWALGMFRKSVLNANQDIGGYLKSRGGKSMLADWPRSDARFFAAPAWLKLMYAAMAEGFRQDGDSINAIYQEHRLFMQPWNEPIEQIPAGKLTLWQGGQDKTCPADNAQKIAQTIKGTRVELFSDEGHCVMFAKTEKLAKDLNE